jgi:hypothetical protein
VYFIEHHSCVIKNPPWKHGEKVEKLEPWIRQLKNKTSFHLQQYSPNQETNLLEQHLAEAET